MRKCVVKRVIHISAFTTFRNEDKHIEFLLLHTLSSLLIFSFPILRDVINPPSPKKLSTRDKLTNFTKQTYYIKFLP